MAVNKVSAALLAILVTTTICHAAEGWQDQLRTMTNARIFISGALAVASSQHALSPQVRSLNRQDLQSLQATSCHTRLSTCLRFR